MNCMSKVSLFYWFEILAGESSPERNHIAEQYNQRGNKNIKNNDTR
jgi:hypothetical protein